MRMLDLFCGRWGWSKAFAARGWECVGVDLIRPKETPAGCIFFQANVLHVGSLIIKQWDFDFICASSPCEEFSVHGMKHFFPSPKYPELGIRLFEHARVLCEQSGLPYVMENVRPAQKFVGAAANHCGPFYLWGPGVPPLLNQGIKKNLNMDRDAITGKRTLHLGRRSSHGSKARAADKALTATIPSELAGCVADYATRICTDGASSQLMRRELVEKTPLVCQKPSSTKEDHG